MSERFRLMPGGDCDPIGRTAGPGIGGHEDHGDNDSGSGPYSTLCRAGVDLLALMVVPEQPLVFFVHP